MKEQGWNEHFWILSLSLYSFLLVRIKTDLSRETENNRAHIYQAQQGGVRHRIERPEAYQSFLELALCSSRSRLLNNHDSLWGWLREMWTLQKIAFSIGKEQSPNRGKRREFWPPLKPNFNPLCLYSMLRRVWLFATPWTVAHQAPLSVELSRQQYWRGSYSRGPSQPRDQNCVSCISCIGRQILYCWATREAL